MSKITIIKDVAEVLEINIAKAGSIVEAVLAEMKDGIIKDGKVIIRKFGTFRALDKKERIGRNPKTGEDAVISARRVPSFKASKKFKAKVNNEDPYL